MTNASSAQQAPVVLVARIIQRTGLRTLLVGGMALNAYGVARQTMDMDLLLTDVEYAPMQKALRAAGFRELHRSALFARWRHATVQLMDVDILFVDAPTFEKLWQARQPVPINGIEFSIPSTQHLLAMKLHAAQHGGLQRTFRDLADVVSLMRAQSVAPDSESFHRLCQTYASEEIYRTVLDAWRKTGGV